MTEVCVICLEDIESSADTILECKHRFHSECLKGMKSRECPLCRKEMTLPEEISGIVEGNIREKKREDDVETRTNIATNMISQGATPNLKVQYLAGVATLKKTFGVSDEAIPSFETMKSRYENELSSGILIATRFIQDTLTSLGRPNDLRDHTKNLGPR